MIVWPKSGWSISITATHAVMPPVISTVGSSGSLTRSDSSQAVVTMNMGLRNSEGWNCAKPNPSQRRAPFTDTPTNGVSARQHSSTTVPTSAIRRAVASGIIDTPNSTGIDSPTQISCRQK